MLKGTGISDGIGLGKAIIFKSQKIKLEKNKIKDVTLEKEKFYKAIKEVEKEIEDLNERLSGVVNKESISEKSNNDESRILLLKNLKKVSDILKSPAVSNETKSKVIRSVVKEIIKTGEDGRTFKIIFNNPL